MTSRPGPARPHNPENPPIPGTFSHWTVACDKHILGSPRGPSSGEGASQDTKQCRWWVLGAGWGRGLLVATQGLWRILAFVFLLRVPEASWMLWGQEYWLEARPRGNSCCGLSPTSWGSVAGETGPPVAGGLCIVADSTHTVDPRVPSAFRLQRCQTPKSRPLTPEEPRLVKNNGGGVPRGILGPPGCRTMWG